MKKQLHNLSSSTSANIAQRLAAKRLVSMDNLGIRVSRHDDMLYTSFIRISSRLNMASEHPAE